jgi:hypothetical protein
MASPGIKRVGCAASLVVSLLVTIPGLALGAPLLDASRSAVSFGRVAVGAEVVQPVFLTNIGDGALTFSGFPITGEDPLDYRLAGTCTPTLVLGPGDRCRLDVVGTLSPVRSSATVTILSDSAGGPLPIVLVGTPSGDITRGLYATPPWVDFDHQPLGTASAPQTLTLTNPERIPAILESVTIGGRNPADFAMTSNCVVGQRYSDNASCAATIAFSPGAAGPRAAEITFQMHAPGEPAGYVTLTYSLTGFGGVVTPVEVVEYYNAALDHYFITWIAAEQANLDAGKTPTKWSRTGNTFHAYAAPQSGTSPVCRYYIPPALGDSHFFGRGTAECDATGQKNPSFVLEDAAFMHMVLPTLGVCPTGTGNIYRVFSNRPDANHRYMTDKATRDGMVAKGWLAEGDGADLVVMCAPL